MKLENLQKAISLVGEYRYKNPSATDEEIKQYIDDLEKNEWSKHTEDTKAYQEATSNGY